MEHSDIVVSTARIEFDVSMPFEMMNIFIQAFYTEFNSSFFSHNPLDDSHIRILIPPGQQQRFFKFIGNFCKERDLTATRSERIS